MALSIQDPEVERLARALADEEGRTVEEVIAEALRARRGWRYTPSPAPPADDREDPALAAERLRRATAFLDATRAELLAAPTLDHRSADDMLYDEFGLPR